MKGTLDHTMELTQYLIEGYYQRKNDRLFSILSEDAIWIEPGNVFLVGIVAIHQHFASNQVVLGTSLEKREFYTLNIEAEKNIVVGRYKLKRLSAYQQYSTQQQVTFGYRIEANNLRLFHVHMSNEGNNSAEISNSTFHSIQEILRDRYIQNNEVNVVVQNDTIVQLLDPNMIVYIEAFGASCVIYYTSHSITIKKILRELESLLPKQFYRPHRSYLVNCKYISSIERYTITLVTGVKIPIPEKRFTAVRKDILMYIKRYKKL